jgi:cytochrome c-type biogenesis protein CcmH
MTIFWVVAVLLIVAALLFLLPPLIQKDAGRDILERDQLNLTIFKDQLAELEADLAAGVLTQEQYETARHDVERSFLTEAGDDTSHAAAAHTDMVVGRSAAVVIAVVIPVLAASLYGLLGSGAAGLHPENARPEVQAEGHKGTLEEQVRKLQEHLQTNPDDVEGWAMLARSYYFLKQYGPASEAFARASQLSQDADPALLTDYADALAMANGRNMAGQPFELVKKALSLQPYNQKALWLAGTATYQAKAYKDTLEYWQRLLQMFPEGSDNYVQMQRNIGEVKQLLGMPVDKEAAAVQQAQASGARIAGMVSLAPALQGRVSPTDTVFVFARAAKGPRMPLAIVRKQVKDLPLKFTLDDSMAMNPAMKLSNFAQVMVGARISKSGNAMPQSGDLQGITGPVAVNDAAAGVELLIDEVVP